MKAPQNKGGRTPTTPLAHPISLALCLAFPRALSCHFTTFYQLTRADDHANFRGWSDSDHPPRPPHFLSFALGFLSEPLSRFHPFQEEKT